MKTDIVTRLCNPPFGTETSERNLMTDAAVEIEWLRAALRRIADGKVDWAHKPADEMRDIAETALKTK